LKEFGQDIYLYEGWGIFMALIGFFGFLLSTSLACVCHVTCCEKNKQKKALKNA